MRELVRRLSDRRLQLPRSAIAREVDVVGPRAADLLGIPAGPDAPP